MSTHPTRVACIGGSITFGLGLEDRRRESYPTLLGKLMGPDCHVRNFGHSGAAAGRETALSYWNTPSILAATRFNPQIVVIALGTNDAQTANLANLPKFTDDLGALTEHFRNLPSADEVVLVLPPPVFEPIRGINSTVLNEHVRPGVEEVSELLALPLVDGYSPLSDRPDLFPDNLHPNAEGARILAETVYGVVVELV
ncbi:MAG: hypothetical protein KDA37_08790 [Planctomycetales bacterium]|nr:hypothetical protein [Planctomycetales bacterium]